MIENYEDQAEDSSYNSSETDKFGADSSKVINFWGKVDINYKHGVIPVITIENN